MTVEVVGFGLAGAWAAIELTKLETNVRVADDGLPGSTHVAAGLVNPVAGRNFQPSWRIEEFWPEARAAYADLDDTLFHPMPIFRKWIEDREKFEKKRALVSPWIDAVDDHGVTWKEGGWLETRRFLQVARVWLAERGVIFEAGSSDLVIRCTGAAGLRKAEFSGIDHRCAKGEILTVEIPGWQEDKVITGGGWIIPIGNQCYRVGATYAWDGLDEGPTQEGREWVERIIKGFTEKDFKVIDHVAGIRPIIRKSQPVIHFQEAKGWMFNGLGSKGVIYAPGVARRLAEHVVNGAKLDEGLKF